MIAKIHESHAAWTGVLGLGNVATYGIMFEKQEIFESFHF
jgi:hypothetical protein